MPCYLYWPGGGIQGGRDIDGLTAHIDLLPTLMDLLGLEEGKHKPFDGLSLKGLLQGKVDVLPARSIIMDQQRIDVPEKGRNAFVMTDDWRLVKGKELYAIGDDPGQQTNVAKEHPEVVAKLTKDFDAWWADVSSQIDEYVRIPLGHTEAPVVTLHSHDWHGPLVPWNHEQVLKGMVATGFWSVDVVETGTYEIEVCRWPRESGLAFGDTPKGATALNIERARLKVQGIDETKTVEPDSKGARFTVNLKAGPARMEAWLDADDGKERGAYYVYVTKL